MSGAPFAPLDAAMAIVAGAGAALALDTEAWAYLGATLLALATLPQALRLLRTREVDQFGWAFIVLNFGGIALLAARSAAIGEAAFLGANLVTAGFWGMAAVGKAWWGRAPPGSAGVEPGEA